jgi:hypothetical protein
MSDFFKNKNDGREFGLELTDVKSWLVVQNGHDINGTTQCAVVSGKTAFEAWQQAEKLIPNFRKQDCQCFPNPFINFQCDGSKNVGFSK